ncbi:hypothetical protein [Sciscionella marina]|uniref:hypothetical protein n=1 Tax=Sciscionella marina TaxID=508770 RepID=UPI0012F660AF|nr:hypothetical protein [Sciscionella marina]
MTNHPVDLPPRPDPQTGEPQPPHAPIYHGDDRENAAARERSEQQKPEPPPGEGPVLAWYQANRRHTVFGFFFGAVVVFLGICIVVWLKGGGFFGWMQYWYIWPIIIIGPLLAALTVRGNKCAAGAEWLRHNKRWVRIYELTKISLRRYTSDMELHLTDSNGRTVEVSTLLLQSDRLVWDLVYNGVLHSAANGATVTSAAKKALKIPEFNQET